MNHPISHIPFLSNSAQSKQEVRYDHIPRLLSGADRNEGMNQYMQSIMMRSAALSDNEKMKVRQSWGKSNDTKQFD